MNITQLINKFRQESGDDVALNLEWSDAYIIDLFNEAVDEACTRKELLFDASTEAVCKIDILEDTVTYSLHDSIIKITKAYLVDSSDTHTDLYLITRDKMDRLFPDWREGGGDVEYLIVDDTSVQLTAPPTEDSTIKFEVYRTPLATEQMIVVVDPATALSPVISTIHHKYLYHWPMKVVFGKDDADYFSPGMSAKHEDEFEQYFGPRPEADVGQRMRNDRPHVNKVW